MDLAEKIIHVIDRLFSETVEVPEELLMGSIEFSENLILLLQLGACEEFKESIIKTLETQNEVFKWLMEVK